MALPPLLAHLALPIIGSPLFIISNPKLVIEQCKAGIVGSMPALNARPAALFTDWLAEITEELAAHDRRHPEAPSAPFAINQIVHRSNDRLEQDMPLMSVEPPRPLPRGTAITRPLVFSSASVWKRQLYCALVSSLLKPAGMLIHMLAGSPPASSMSTRCCPEAVSRLARMQPAVPPPTMT